MHSLLNCSGGAVAKGKCSLRSGQVNAFSTLQERREKSGSDNL
jgi:hypothetical protein